MKAALAAGRPAISVDTKKKELVGDFKNDGREWRPNGSPEEVRVHDSVIPELGRAVPYGVYDIADNVGWVSVGIDHDTAAFATNAIRSWWQLMGRERYPASRCPTPNSKPSTSSAMTSTANGTIPSAQKSSPWSNNSRTRPKLGDRRRPILTRI